LGGKIVFTRGKKERKKTGQILRLRRREDVSLQQYVKTGQTHRQKKELPNGPSKKERISSNPGVRIGTTKKRITIPHGKKGVEEKSWEWEGKVTIKDTDGRENLHFMG